MHSRFGASTALSTPAILKAPRRRAFTTDGMTYDQFTIDSTGSFLIGELERLDMTLHEPLVSVTWGRDIVLREDVTIADEISSFTNSAFASPGGIVPGGISWASKTATAISTVALDIGKTTHPLYLWANELSWTLPELASAERIGRPIDQQKYNAMRVKHQMDIDQVVYIGDTTFNTTGLLNNSAVTNVSTAAATGTGSTTQWTNKTPVQILADVNTLLQSVWAASGYAVMPSKLLLPPAQFGYIVSQLVSSAGNVSIIEFLRANSLTNAALGKPLDIQPVKWLNGLGVGGTQRICAYSNDRERVRFPLVPLQRTPIEYKSLFQLCTYFGRLGVVEVVYPETIGYMDGC